MPAKKKAEPKQFVDPNPVMTASREIHPGWERAKVDYEIKEMRTGWHLVCKTSNDGGNNWDDWPVGGILFPNEESALKVAQAIVDYSAGPSNPLPDKPQTRKRPMAKTEISSSAAA